MLILYKNKEVLQNKKMTKMVEKSILRSIFQNKFEIFFIDTNSKLINSLDLSYPSRKRGQRNHLERRKQPSITFNWTNQFVTAGRRTLLQLKAFQ